MGNSIISKIVAMILLIMLVLVGKVDGATLTTKLGNEYVNVTVEKDEIVNMKFTSKEGFRFRRWVIEEGSIDNIDTTQEEINFPMPDSNVVIRGEYDTTYRITFNRNDNGDGSGEMADMVIPAGGSENLTINTFERAGYDFKGWSTEKDETVEYEDGVSCTPRSDLTLYAVWGIAEVRVQFESNGGSTVNDITVIYGETYGDLPTPSKTGYTFKGWYKEEELTTKVTSETNVTEISTHILYAKWTANTYTVRYDSNGGSGSMSNTSFTYGTAKALRKNTFTRANCTFAGWSTSQYDTSVKYTDGEKVTDVAASGTTTLYAIWRTTVDQLSSDDRIGFQSYSAGFFCLSELTSTKAVLGAYFGFGFYRVGLFIDEIPDLESCGELYTEKCACQLSYPDYDESREHVMYCGGSSFRMHTGGVLGEEFSDFMHLDTVHWKPVITIPRTTEVLGGTYWGVVY